MTGLIETARLPGFDGKVAVVTGGARGIGSDIALSLALQGCDVAVLDVDSSAGSETVAVLRDIGVRARFFSVDVSDDAAVEACVEAIHEDMGGPDILINNAGIMEKVAYRDVTVEQWRRLLDINLLGTFTCSRAVAPYLIERGGGSIIMISSGSAITGTGQSPHYAASKGGVNSLVRYFAKELGPSGIRVNGVAPRTIDSDILQSVYSDEERQQLAGTIPLQRLGTGKDVANVVNFLASDLSSYMTGEVLLLDGGRTYVS